LRVATQNYSSPCTPCYRQSAKDELFLLGKQAFEIAQKSGVELFHQAYESMIQLCVNTKQMGYADFVFETGKEVEYIPTSETGALLVKVEQKIPII